MQGHLQHIWCKPWSSGYQQVLQDISKYFLSLSFKMLMTNHRWIVGRMKGTYIFYCAHSSHVAVELIAQVRWGKVHMVSISM